MAYLDQGVMIAGMTVGKACLNLRRICCRLLRARGLVVSKYSKLPTFSLL